MKKKIPFLKVINPDGTKDNNDNWDENLWKIAKFLSDKINRVRRK